jgi:hypothetical protein
MSSEIDVNNALTTTKQYLKKMEIPFSAEQEQNLLIAWNIKGINFPATITVANGYLFLYSIIMLRSELKNVDLKQVYEHLLRASHKLPEVAFDLDDFGNIGTGQEIPLNGLTFEVFKSELNAIPAALLYFLETVVPECNLKMQVDAGEQK